MRERLEKSFSLYRSTELAKMKSLELFVGAVPSPYYRRWVLQPEFFPWVAQSYRYNGIKDPPIQVEFVKDFVFSHADNYDPLAYGYVVPTIDASFKSLANYARPQPVVDHDVWIIATQWLHQTYAPYMSGSRIATWDFVEDYADKSTSCGFFWRENFPTKGDFLQWSGRREFLQNYWEQASYELPSSIWQVSDKYEMRPSAKLQEDPPSIRTFLVGPIEYVLSMNRYCLHGNELFYASNVSTPSSVGRSKYMLGFQEFIDKLTSYGRRFQRGFCFDFSKYDMSMFIELFMTICELRLSCIHPDDRSPENDSRFRNLYRSMLSCFVWTVTGEFLYKTTGNNSGQPNTLPDNTMAQTQLWYYVFLVLFLKQRDVKDFPVFADFPSFLSDTISDVHSSREFPSLEKFDSMVSPLFCGDDSVMGVDEGIFQWFNVESISNVFSTLGMKVTCESLLPQEISSFDFLSHRFVQLPGSPCFLPSPSTSKVMCSLYVGSGSTDIRWVLLRAFALRIESWANLECRKLLSDFITLTMAHYRDELCGSIAVPSAPTLLISWKTILASYLSDDVLRRLYYGYESVGTVKQFTAFKYVDRELLDLPFRTLFF